MVDRGFNRRRARVGAVLAVALLFALALGGTSQASTSTQSSGGNLLGTKNPAKGAPIKIGFVTDDKNQRTDNSIETPVADATAKWINEYRNGIGGRPIELDRCVDLAEPSKGTDCANQMIQDKVAAVVIGSNAVLENVWNPLKTAGIPVFLYGASNPAVTADTASTFIITNGRAFLLNLPAGVAKETKAKKVSAVALDVPAATSFFKDPGPSLFQKQGLQLELIPIAAGTADMTPQMQRLTSDNPNGVVFIIGNDTFCIAALNGLRTAAFKGTITTIPQCLTDATRTSVPADFLKGIRIAASAPLDDPKDPTIKQYYAVLNKYGAGDVDKSSIGGISMFNVLAGFDVATEGVKGDVTPAAIIAAAKAMPWSVLPGTGGLHFRCNGKADPAQPATCANNVLIAKLDAEGKATSYTPVGDTKIAD
jgi:branched-chain amino acid transport system substrate-binding protein